MTKINSLEILTYKNNWLVKRQYKDDCIEQITIYNLELFSTYYKDLDNDLYFVSNLVDQITNFNTKDITTTNITINIINDTEYVSYENTNNIFNKIKYDGKPPLAYRK